MSIRVLALYMMITGLSIYAWKDWYKSLCGLILLMAVIEHGDMPRAMFGIPGLNTWNVLFGVIFLAWAVNRRREGLRWDVPRYITVLLLMYLGVIVLGVLRAAFNRGYLDYYPLSYLVTEELLNTIKWVLPGLLLLDGCRTRRRAVMALACLLTMYSLIAIQLVRNMPPNAAFSGGQMIQWARSRACSRIGYSTGEMSTMLVGGFWGMLAVLPCIRRKKYWAIVLPMAAVLVFAVATTGCRAGYLACGATGLALCLLKWRKYLILAPVVAVLLPVVFPGVVDRMLTGFGEEDAAGQTVADLNAVTSGRATAWPYVVAKIAESPWIGHGRLAMQRTGLTERIENEHPGTGAPHPHNMYLETFLDNGILGSLPILLFWATVVVYSARLFRSRNRLYSAVGGLSLAAALAQLTAGIGAQHFYPLESTLGTWAAMCLMLRVHIEEARAQALAVNTGELPEVTLARDRSVPVTAPEYVNAST